MSLSLRPITFAVAAEFIRTHHRHHGVPVGHKFSIGVEDGEKLVGVCVVGRPVARHLDDGYTAEVTRLATDGTKNACSILYAAAWRAARAMGYRKLVTYILASESGGSLVATGWKCVGQVTGRSWSVPSRPRVDKHPTVDKTRWEVSANA